MDGTIHDQKRLVNIAILIWVLLAASGVLHAGPKQRRPPKRRYHCICGDICIKAAPGERCLLKGCNGKDVPQAKARARNPS
jgi:hypothetical protein